MTKTVLDEDIKSELDRAAADIEQKSDEYANAADNIKASLQKSYDLLAEEGDEASEESEGFHEFLRETAQRLKNSVSKSGKAYLSVTDMADEIEARVKDVEKSQKRKRGVIAPPPANTTIDFEEKEKNNFAQGTNFYKLFLICFIGSFAGVVVELIWCLIRNGYIESRSGLVYGPFNLLYGMGAVALTLTLYRFRNRSTSYSFVGGMVIGSAVEYLCSFLQGLILGTRSWDYSNVPFNLNGRICLLYAVFWGVLSVMWIKNIYPRVAKLILKIPNKAGKMITALLAVFMAFNAAVSGLAVYRWSQRVKGVEPSNGLYEFMDKHFPNERMEKVYANMEFVEE